MVWKSHGLETERCLRESLMQNAGSGERLDSNIIF